jgi:LmbE family N-acetylglucosaminyl deacetylase
VATALTDIATVLVVTAHPDDVDFAAGGTIAVLTDAGVEVAYAIATDGQTGGFDPGVPRDRMAHLRQAEQRAAGEVLGVHDITFLGFVDGEVEVTLELRRAIARQIRRVQPDVVITTSPQRDWDRVAGPGHPDHLAVGEATVRAVYPDARNPFAFPELLADEGLGPHTVQQIWLTGGPDPDHAVDVTEQLDRKLAAIHRHATQLPEPAAIDERIRRYLGTNAVAVGWSEDRAAERFRIVPTG